MRLLAFSDVHRDGRQAARLADMAGDADVVIGAGDFASIHPGDRVLLIVEHDPKFAGILLEMAHEKGFKALITSSGEAAMQMARDCQ